MIKPEEADGETQNGSEGRFWPSESVYKNNAHSF